VDEKVFIDYLYGRLPEIYRQEDSKIGTPLYRFLKALCDSGYAPVIKDVNNFLNLLDPDICPSSFFKQLYESFGFTYTEGVSEKYMRKILGNAGELRKRRGTYSYVRYLVRVLTGMEVDLEYIRGYNTSVNEFMETQGRWLNIYLIATTIEQALNINTDISVIRPLLEANLPFYITPTFTTRLQTLALQSAETRIYGAMSYSNRYTLTPLGA
jgi:phage tail-like protein